MSCKITYNQNQEPIGVLDNNGNPSKTFQQILSNPNIKGFDQALEIYKGMLSLEQKSPEEKTETEDLTPQIQQKVNEGDNSLPHAKQIRKKGIDSLTPSQLEEVISAFTGEVKTRVADRLPLTLSIFNTKQFVDMRGKMVNPISVQQMLNGAGIKQIEKDLINQVIEDNYKGQKRISYDELEATVRANLMPLERITTSSYADYGMDNLGSGNYGEAKTIILNSPIEHGVTGHFSGDFKASGRQNVKYVPKQLNDNVWVAVEEGYESQANDNNIYQYVGTAGTKEAVDAWIDNYKNQNFKNPGDKIKYYNFSNQLKDGIVIEDSKDFLYVEDVETGEKLNVPKPDEKDINKGMFGHIRVWQDGDVFYTAELQSDFYQKNNARKLLLGSKIKQAEEKVIEKRVDEISKKLNKVLDEMYNLGLPFGASTSQIDNFGRGQTNEINKLKEAQANVRNNKEWDEIGNKIEELEERNFKLYNERKRLIRERDKTPSNLRYENDKEFLKEVEVQLENSLSPQEKQFIASQKIWEQRMVREAIKEASLSGATSLRFPTPYTLSVIEEYLSEGAPYEIESADDSTYLEAGDRIYYAGEDYTVVDSDSTTITIAESGRVSSSLDEDIISQEVDNAVDNDMYEIENNLKDFYTQEEWNDFRDNYSPISSTELDEVGNEIEEGVFEVSEGKIRDIISEYYSNIFTDAESIIKDIYGNDVWVNGNTVTWTDGTANIETLMQPSEYKGQGTKDSFSIEEDLDDTQQTVARKYEEIAEILKKEKPVEIVTDENGFDWYEAPITEADTQTPVVAFSLQQQEPSLKYKVNNGVYNSFAEALRASTNDKIEAGVNTVDGFQTLFTVDSNTNQSTHIGFINAMIKGGLLNGEVDQDGNLKPEGQSFAKKTINGYSVKELYQKQFGVKTAKLNFDGSVSLYPENARTKVEITLKNGEKKTINLTDLNKPFKELKAKYDVETTSAILASNEIKNYYNKTESTKDYDQIIPENELQEKALSLLKKLGFKTLSIVDYLNNYSQRNGKAVDASALIDTINKVVAFKDGVVTEDDLLEEVAHLIESSIPQEQKENILRNIHKTKEWMDNYELYKDAYATEEELRREILGKVIANGIKNNFQSRNQNATEDTILARLKELFDDIIRRVSAFFKPQYQNEIDALNKEVYKKLMQEELFSDSFSKGTFFSLEANKLFKSAEKLLKLLEEQDKQFSRKFKNPTDRAAIETAEKDLKNAQTLKGLATLVRVASSQVEALTKASNTKDGFSAEENVTYQNLINRILPALQEAKAFLNNTDKLHVEAKAEIDKIALKAGNLQSAALKARTKRFDEMVENILTKNEVKGTPDEALYRETLRNALENVQKDTDFFHAHLGSLFQAKNPLLNIAGDVIERMNLQSLENFQSPAKKLTNTLAELGMLGQKDLKPLYDKYGIINQIDKEKQEKDDYETKKLILERILEKQIEDSADLDVIISNLSEGDLLGYNASWEKARSERYIPRVKPEFTKQLNNTVVTINGQKYSIDGEGNRLSRNLIAMEINKSFESEKASVYNNAESDLLTASEQAKIQEINRRRFEASNPRDEQGKFLKGLTEVYSEEYGKYVTIIDEESFAKAQPLEQQKAFTVFGLQTLALIKQEAYKKFNEGKTPTEKFVEEFSNSQNPVEFLKANAFVSFPDSYYESFKNSDGIIDRLRDLGTVEAEKKIEEIREKRAIVNRILRQHSVYNSPGETNFSEMSRVSMKDVEFAQRDLENLYSQAKTLLPKVEQDYDIDAETVPNKAYSDHLKDAGIESLEDKLYFIKEHTTSQGRKSIETAEAIVFYGAKIPSFLKNYFSETMSQPEKEKALEKYAQTKLLPYLKKTEPRGYSEVMKAFEDGGISPRELVENYQDIVKISPSPQYYEGTDFDNVNPIWRTNKQNGNEQYTQEYLKKVGNQKYFDMFDIDPLTNQPRSNKNEKLWKARKALLETMDTAIDYNNKTGMRNRYMSPQIRRRTAERVFGAKPKDVKEALKDALQFRPEEQELGNPNNIYSIPVYYDAPLENKDEVTENYLYSTLMYLQAASLHKARRENIADMLVIEGALLGTNTENKASDATNTYKMFKNFMEYNFFGVKETVNTKIADGRVDVGKTLRTLNNFAKKLNLQGITVPITSMLQSGTQKFMERVIAEHINSVAANEGNKLFSKMFSDAAKEVMGFQSKAPLNVIMEALGLYNMVHRYEDSQYSKAGRLALNGSSKLHELGNFPIIPRGVLGIIADYRIVDGKVLSYSQFKKKKDETREWTSFKYFHPVFFSAVKDGVLDFTNEEFLKQAEKAGIVPHNGQTLSEYLEGKKEAISKRSLTFTQRTDSQIPQHQRSIASRHAVMNFFLSHMNWLLTAIPNKIKQKHFNLSEEMRVQEGSWRTTANFIGKIMMNPKKIKEIYSQLEPHEKKNLKRAVIELGFANALAFLAIILAGFNDDDDDPNYALAVADMFASRLAVEQISSTVALPSGIGGALDSPLMLKQKAESWAKVSAYFTEDGTDKDRTKFLKSVLPYYTDLLRWEDPHQTRLNYMYHGEYKKGLFDNYAWLSNLVDEE